MCPIVYHSDLTAEKFLWGLSMGLSPKKNRSPFLLFFSSIKVKKTHIILCSILIYCIDKV